MGLATGTKLGPYEILSALGAGGMGEVYKARDTRLGRDVAVKVLPAGLSADVERLQRFEQEARAVAALNHPNILALYDIGTHDTAPYLVTELLEGATLRETLAAGPLPVRKALEYAAQLARGLAAAHEKGIVHRDLKPENVFVTGDGRVKILDFGLAKLTQADVSGLGASMLPTVPPQTAGGVVLGTVGYMSPEQVHGRVADHRSDIFSLGAVLYEMFGGQRAFVGESPADTLSAILKNDPAELPASVPAGVCQIVEHCLEKEPARRFQSANDLAFALSALSGSTTSSGQTVPVAATPRRRAPAIVAVTAGALVLGALTVFLAGRYAAGRAAGVSTGPQIVSFTQVTDLPGVETTPSLSPDGKSVVYAKTVGADTALYLLHVGGRNAVRLSAGAPAQDLEPAFSPDGEHIAFRSERDGGGVFLMTASGESVTRLTNGGYSPSWSPDGAEIVVSQGGFDYPTDLSGDATGLSVVNVKSGQTRALAFNGRSLQPSWSPGGARIAFWGVRGASGQRDLWTIATDGSDAARGGVPVTNDAALDWSPAWSPDGRYLYFSSTRGGTMSPWRVAIDQSSGRVLGEPEPVTTPSTWSGGFSFSQDGTRLAFASLDYRSTLFRVPFDAAREAIVGPSVPLVKGTRPIRDHELSPDGQWIAFNEAGVQEDLFVARTDGTQYRRLTDDAFRDRGPAWSPDGARIAFYSDRSGGYELWTIRPDGSGLAALTRGMGIPGFPTWSPDGTRVAAGFGTWYFLDANASSAQHPAAEPAISPTERFWPASWSPTGARIVGQVMTTDGSVAGLGVYTLATRRFARVPGEAARAGSWLWAVWLADGRRLIVRRPEGVAVVNADTGASRLLIPVGGYMYGRSVGVSRDNRWITYTETATEGDIWIATLKKQG